MGMAGWVPWHLTRRCGTRQRRFHRCQPRTLASWSPDHSPTSQSGCTAVDKEIKPVHSLYRLSPLPITPDAHGVLALTLISVSPFLRQLTHHLLSVAFFSFSMASFSPGCSPLWQKSLKRSKNTGQAVDGGTTEYFWSPESSSIHF